MGSTAFVLHHIERAGVPLASRHFSLNMSEVGDMTDVMLAFEKHNNVRIKVDMELIIDSAAPDLMITAKAMEVESKDTEVLLLASVSVKCSSMNLKSMNAVLTHVLYALDFQLALNEFEKVPKKRA